MSKVLNRIVFGGDITKAIDRKDSETAMIIIEGATDDVILQTCDTENGTFENFKKIAEFAENLFVGVQLKIDGCKKFVKVIGAEKASVVFGDTKYNPSDFIPVGSAGGGGESLKYHLYAWDYSNGTAIAYSEKALPQAGDVVFLKQDMEGGKITDTNELKLVYHVVSDSDGVITVSEHPEGTTGGYTFNRNEADDYEEEVSDIRDLVDITQNGLLISQKGTMFKGANVKIGSDDWAGGSPQVYMEGTQNYFEAPTLKNSFLIPANKLFPESDVECYILCVNLRTGFPVTFVTDPSDSNPFFEGVDIRDTDEFGVCVAMLDTERDWDNIKNCNMLSEWGLNHTICPLTKIPRYV